MRDLTNRWLNMLCLGTGHLYRRRAFDCRCRAQICADPAKADELREQADSLLRKANRHQTREFYGNLAFGLAMSVAIPLGLYVNAVLWTH